MVLAVPGVRHYRNDLGASMTDYIDHNMPAAEYHAVEALSASGAWTLAADCPAVYWHSSPFNPNAGSADSSGPMDIGTALHLAVLEPDQLECRSLVVDAADWRTKTAKEQRNAAYAAGSIPLLAKDSELVQRLRAVLLRNEHVTDMLYGARTEVSYFWNAEGINMKARADIISRDGLAIGDLKASVSASPEFFSRQAFNAGHFLRSPWYQDGWEAVTGKRAEYFYIIVSRQEPYLVTVARLDERAISWGRLMIRRAMILFEVCRKQNRWPGYFDEPVTLSLPSWSEYRLADAEQEKRFDPEAIRRGIEFLAPVTESAHA